jgi:hypothetical protein
MISKDLISDFDAKKIWYRWDSRLGRYFSDFDGGIDTKDSHAQVLKSTQHRSVVTPDFDNQCTWLELEFGYGFLGIVLKVLGKSKRTLRGIDVIAVDVLWVDYCPELHMTTHTTLAQRQGEYGK